MSDLKNIFYGERVVQQAYLNDALIYQADSWTNTPSTKQLDYISSLPLLRKTRWGASVKFNSKNEMIIFDAQYQYTEQVSSTYVNHFCYRISKVDPSTGTLLYSKVFDKEAGAAPSGVYLTSAGYQSSYNDEEYMYIDKNDNIHVVYNNKLGNSSTYTIFLLNITDTGKDFSAETMQLDPAVASGSLYTVAFDDNYFYLSILLNNHYVVKAIDYTCRETHEMITPTSWQITSLGTYTDSVYLYGYAASNQQVVQFNKYTWTSKILDMSFSPNSSYVNRMSVDKMNNLYFYRTLKGNYSYGHQIVKYSVVNKKTSTFELYSSGYAETYHLAFDSKYNMYVFCNDLYNPVSGSSWSGTMCYKVSPALTQEWKAIDFVNKERPVAGMIGNVFIDNYDSIYVLFPVQMSTSTYDYAYKIYKYSNLEQVQSS